MLAVILVALVLSHACVHPVLGYGEPDASGHPNYQERANHVFLNAVRVSPSQYKSKYMAGYSPSPASILTSYPACAPVRLEPKLVNSAFFHSNDMAVHNCFSHPSCDGTDTFARIKSYYTCSGTMGENIAAGNADPLDTSNQWLCDSTGSACAGDKSGSDGHRSNMMGTGYTAVGVGFAYSASATYKNYWTQDFGGASCSSISSPIYGASHRVKSGSTLFIAVYYTSPAVAPSTASVVIAGTSYALSLDIGAPGAGTYAFSQTSGSGCRSYYFNIGGVRFPETGCLVTYNEGTCTSSFDASCSGSPAAATVATVASSISTTAAVTVTTAAATVTTGSSTTGGGGGGVYWVYTSALQNSWATYANSGATLTNSYTYNGRTGLKAALTTSANFFMLSHSPDVTNVWTNLQFYVAGSASGSFIVYFNGGYYQTKTVTTAWQQYTIPLSSLGDPNAGGAAYSSFGTKQLIYQIQGSSALTLYLSGVSFL